MIDWKTALKYLFNIDLITVIIVVGFCIYFYYKYDRNKPKSAITLSDIKFPIFKKKEYGKTEEQCRRIFEKIFDKKFVSCRPEFLKNPATGQNLELDGYCEELKLAFEYDGCQHAKYNPHFHRNPKEFIYQVKKDSYKNMKCRENNITLIRIPHFVKAENLESYIVKELKSKNIIK